MALNRALWRNGTHACSTDLRYQQRVICVTSILGAAFLASVAAWPHGCTLMHSKASKADQR